MMNFCRALMVGLGLSTALVGVAQSEESTDSARESIIQGVRDDVRRKIREREAKPPNSGAKVATKGRPTKPHKTEVNN